MTTRSPAHVQVLADSVSPNGARLTTMLLTYTRNVHEHLLTHRVFARCSASSRATPVEAMITQAEHYDSRPTWGLNASGMSPKGEPESAVIEEADQVWIEARQDAVKHARRLAALGLHKQHVNDLLRPFQPIRTVVTGASFQGFFAQRRHHTAKGEMRVLADAMHRALEQSKPRKLGATLGSVTAWHLPFFGHDTPEKHEDLMLAALRDPESKEAIKKIGDYVIEHRRRLMILPAEAYASAARCARTSYAFARNGAAGPLRDPVEALKADLDLAWRLLCPPGGEASHMQPFEHVAVCAADHLAYAAARPGPFQGWITLRQIAGAY